MGQDRRSRIIPRADVHTTQDITIEELRPREMPPADFAPPARVARPDAARRRRRQHPDGSSASGDGGYWRTRWRITTRPPRRTIWRSCSTDCWGLSDLGAGRGLARSPSRATVPALSPGWARLGPECTSGSSPLAGSAPGVRTGVPAVRGQPARGRPGPHRQRRGGPPPAYGGPCIVVDFGTVHELRRGLRGRASTSAGCSRPGIEISMEALWARAARLTKVDLVAPRTVIGQVTPWTALQSGERLRLRRTGGRHRAPHARRARGGVAAIAGRRAASRSLIVPHAADLQQPRTGPDARGAAAVGPGGARLPAARGRDEQAPA